MTDETKAALKALELFSARHPRPSQVNQKQAAEMLGVSARTIYNMLKAGTLKLNRCGMIPIEQVDAVLEAA
jgi:excisionase family DNA binding protein